MKFLSDLREVISLLKHQKPTQIFCPKCKSPNIRLSSQHFVHWLTRQYTCEECGYNGPVVIEMEKEYPSPEARD
ncbi:MAG: hypothetical protein QHH24_08020 [Candidatus Bathyarchaeota archaeon]|nr:hypothetical protein [Candidatus Bathyarchaeota archaeon]